MNSNVCIIDENPRYASIDKVRQKVYALLSLRAIAILAAFAVIMPMLVILSSVLQPESDIWRHIVDTLLVDLIKNTAILGIGVIVGTFLLGVGLAWLTAVCDFPGRKFFNWALMLPLAIPTYVLAFVFIGLLDFSGPVQTFLRSFGVSSLGWIPNIRSTGGVIVVLSLALYPYVYLLARNAFQTQGKSILEASRILGHRPYKAFVKAALPMARPWIASGLMLVLMETLADFGAVSIFNYDTFTTGIYKAWFGFFSLTAAAQLSSVLLVFVFLLIIVEQHMRQRMRFHQVGRMAMQTVRIKLHGWKKWTTLGGLTAVFVIAFVVPCLQLAIWSIQSISVEFDIRYLGLLSRSLFFSSTAAALITAFGLFLAYIQRHHDDKFTKWMIRFSTMGYALPGTVLAVGIVIMINSVDNSIIRVINELSGAKLSSVFNGTIVIVLFAYSVRFLTVGFNSTNSSMQRITKNIDEASRLMGITGFKLLKRIHIPILKNGLFIAAMLVFVDVMKEMPITLMTRPFGWDTLAVKIFELTSEGEWKRAALPSITLIFAGLIPLMILNKKADQSAL